MNKYLLTKAVKLINEYSKPLTRPDWKSIKRIPNMGYIYNIIVKNTIILPVFSILINNILNGWNINIILTSVKTYGIFITSKYLNIPINILNNIIVHE